MKGTYRPRLGTSKSRPKSYPPLAKEIIKAVYRCVELIGADEQLLAVIGSWDETLEDEHVIENLRFWIKMKEREILTARRSRCGVRTYRKRKSEVKVVRAS